MFDFSMDFTLGYLQYLFDMPQQFMDKMWFDVANIPVFIAWLIAWITGFLLYTYAGKVTKEQGVQPYPMWIHAYMFSIDTIGVITFAYLAITNSFYWFFVFQVIALSAWLYMEFQSIKNGLNDAEERDFEFGNLAAGGHISREQAKKYCIGIFFAGFAVNVYLLSMIGGFANMAIWIIYPWTNFVYVVFTWRFWHRRAAQFGNRKHNSIGLQVVILITTIVSWLPGISWYWVVSPFFHQPFYVLGGLGVTAVAVYNLWFCRQLPEYDATEDPDSPMFEGKKDVLEA